MKVTFQLILALKGKFQRFKEKSEHISVEKRSCLRTLSQVYKFRLYRYCKSSFLLITKQKKKKIFWGDWKFLDQYIYKTLSYFLKKSFQGKDNGLNSDGRILKEYC